MPMCLARSCADRMTCLRYRAWPEQDQVYEMFVPGPDGCSAYIAVRSTDWVRARDRADAAVDSMTDRKD